MSNLVPPRAKRSPSARITPSLVDLLHYCALRTLVAAAVGGAAGATWAAAQEPAAVRYLISFEQGAGHYVEVEANFPTSEPQQELYIPIWTPGSYLVREYARHIDSVIVTGEAGNPVEVKKINKNRWQISNAESQAITVNYRVYCNELSVRTNFVDREFALLNGAALFLTTDNCSQLEHVVELKLPPDWRQAVTSLERRVRLGPNAFVAKDFDELVDSPFVVGNPTLHPFEVGGVVHYLVNQGGDGLWDGEQAAADVAKIVEVHQEMWGQVPYKRYFFLNVIAESGGGLEHDNSTVMLTSRWGFRAEKRYKSWLSLVSHEFFHAWNVRRLRPKALATYDYEVENYFDELWVAEGVTSYYDDLALARSGHVKTTEYLATLSRQIKTLQTTDGRFKQSLAESSHDAWIKYYRPNENSRNTTISYYNKGALVAFLLDIEIRRATNNEKSLDDVMRNLYAQFASQEDGYTTQDVIAEVNRLTGDDWNDWFQRAIYSADELDYQPALDWLGLKFAHQVTPKSEASDEPKQAAKVPTEKAETGSIWTGLNTKDENGKLLVSAVAENGPAFDAGINVNDEILAINNYRVSDSLSDRLEQFQDDGEVELLISRRGVLKPTKLMLVRREVQNWKLGLIAEPTEMQTSNLAAWLHQSMESEKSPASE